MRLKALLAVVLVCAVAATPALTQEDAEPNLIVSSMIEPPDGVRIGGKFRTTFTISNDGRDRAGATVMRGYLSRNASKSNDDTRLTRSREIPALDAGEEATRRVTLFVPADIEAASYHLILCADDTRRSSESDERNCSVSGQRITVGPGEPTEVQGPPGAAGPPGEKGEAGPPGRGAELMHRLPRTVLRPAEGDTASSDPLTVGPFRFRYECENAAAPDPDVARLLVISESGTMSVQGHHTDPGTPDEGRRPNVPAGTPALVIGGARDPGDGASTVPDDPATGGDESNGANFSGFKAKRAYVLHDNGAEAIIDAFAGVDTLGAGEPEPGNADECVLGGNVTVVQP